MSYRPPLFVAESEASMLKFNGHEYVDLGLPSGTLWAKYNVGATSETDFGTFFAWGETAVHSKESSCLYNAEENLSDDEYRLGLTLIHDAARANMGGEWHIPTEEDFQELLDECDVTWIENFENSTIPGCQITSRINGNSIFLPAHSTGLISQIHYWTSSVTENEYMGETHYEALEFYASGYMYEYSNGTSWRERNNHLQVRAVCK